MLCTSSVTKCFLCRRRGETVFLTPPSEILASQAIPPRFLASCKWNTSTAATRRKVACQEGEMRTNEAPLRPPPRPLRAKKSNTKNGGPQRIYGIVELNKRNGAVPRRSFRYRVNIRCSARRVPLPGAVPWALFCSVAQVVRCRSVAVVTTDGFSLVFGFGRCWERVQEKGGLALA